MELTYEKNGDYLIIYPNNDLGSEIILNAYRGLQDRKHYRIFQSIRFEYFLTLLKNADFMIGNSSAGVRETCVYGIPSIDIGSRQRGRYDCKVNQNIQHVAEEREDILRAIKQIDAYRQKATYFGDGNSTRRFLEIISKEQIWNHKIQKVFVDR